VICAGDSLPEDSAMEVEVAIVGAGAVGIAVAVRLASRVGRVALIEAGGTQFKHAQSLSFFRAGLITDARHPPTELYRRRMLGGTTSVWGGRCIPLEPEDIIPTPARSGWPISFAEVDAHVSDALEFLDAGRPEFSAAAALPTNPVSLDASADDLVVDRIERFSKPTNAWRKWGAALARSRDLTVIHGATCTNILSNADSSRAVGLELRTPSNRSLKILASTIVLTCGGLETPRLLLASRGSRSCGLGNEHDLVGRFYMTHLVGNVGYLHFAAAQTARAFDYGMTPDGIYGRRLILLSGVARQREGIGNIVFRPTIPAITNPSHHDPVLSAMFFVKTLIIPEYARRLSEQPGGVSGSSNWRDHGANIALGVPRLCKFGVDWLRRRVCATRKLPSVFLYRTDGTYPLEFNAEHMPNAESRVLVGRDADPFGVPRLIVQWQAGDSEIDSICRAYRLLAAAVAKSGLGAVRVDPDLSSVVRHAVMPQAGHHIGTVRMGSDPRNGVINANGELWCTRGLFVAGTAIFPTSGFANPTLAAVALAFRLADHLVQRQTGTNATMKISA
jgi:choline dehydrogenase-like flavoprotein